MPKQKHSHDLAQVASELEASSLEQRFAMIQERWGDQLLATTSFGLQSAVMLDLLKKHAPEIPIVFIDTGYLFAETYHYAQQLMGQLNLDILTYSSDFSAARQEALYGKLWEQGEKGLKQYAELNKIEPMDCALSELKKTVWISGLRRSQSKTRSARSFVEKQNATTKIYPILDWNQDKVDAYMEENQLPRHPLHEKYLTLGDWHSTKSIAQSGGDPERSRFNGNKYECGLHEESDNYQI